MATMTELRNKGVEKVQRPNWPDGTYAMPDPLGHWAFLYEDSQPVRAQRIDYCDQWHDWQPEILHRLPAA